MPEQPDNLGMDQLLSAFADGELSAAQRLQVLNYLAAHPEAMQWVRDQQRLSLAARRLLDSPDAKAPKSLRSRISQMSVTSPQTAPSAETTRPLAVPTALFGKWWIALAACVLVAIGIEIERVAYPPASTFTPSIGEPVIAASIVAHASRVHADCSRLAEWLHSAGYPKSQGTLADDVEHDLHSIRPYPNLGPIGFRYVGAGPCDDPLPNAIHLLYHSMKPGSEDAISLFVQPYQGQFALEPGEIYDVSGPDSPFPMLSWRTRSVVYFLIADNDQMEQKALSLIRGDITKSAAAASEPSDTESATRP